MLSVVGKKPIVTVNKKDIVVRLWKNNRNTFMWIVNLRDENQKVSINVDENMVKLNNVDILRGNTDIDCFEHTIIVEVDGCDAAVLKVC